MRCVICNKNAKFYCQDCKDQTFCSKECSIGLGMYDGVVGIQSKDGYKIEITQKQAQKLDSVYDQIKEFGSKNYFIFESINSQSLSIIYNVLHGESLPKLDDESYFTLFFAAIRLRYNDLLKKLILTFAERVLNNTNPSFVNYQVFKDFFPRALYFLESIEEIEKFVEKVFDNVYPQTQEMLENIKQWAQNRSAHEWPIYYSVVYSDFEILKLMLQMKDDYDGLMCFGLHLYVKPIVKYNRIRAIQFILENVNSKKKRLDFTKDILREACKQGNFEIVKFLVEVQQFDMSAFSVSGLKKEELPLTVAAENGRLEIVEYLILLPEVDVSYQNYKAIVVAHKNQHFKVFDFLFNRPGVDKDAVMVRVQQQVQKDESSSLTNPWG